MKYSEIQAVVKATKAGTYKKETGISQEEYYRKQKEQYGYSNDQVREALKQTTGSTTSNDTDVIDKAIEIAKQKETNRQTEAVKNNNVLSDKMKNTVIDNITNSKSRLESARNRQEAIRKQKILEATWENRAVSAIGTEVKRNLTAKENGVFDEVGKILNNWNGPKSTNKENFNRKNAINKLVENGYSEKHAENIVDNWGNREKETVNEKEQNRDFAKKSVEYLKQNYPSAYERIMNTDSAKGISTGKRLQAEFNTKMLIDADNVDERYRMYNNNEIYDILIERGMTRNEAGWYAANWGTIQGIIDAENYENKRAEVVANYSDDIYDAIKELTDIEREQETATRGESTGFGKAITGLSYRRRYEEALQKVDDLKAKYNLSEDEYQKLKQYVREIENQNITEASQEEINKAIADSRWAAWGYNAADIITSPVQGGLAFGEKLKQKTYADKEAPIDIYSSNFALSNMSNAVQEATNTRIANNADTEFGAKAGQFMYGVGSSTAKSMMNMALAGGAGQIASEIGAGAKVVDAITKVAGLPSFGASAYASTLAEDMQKGIGADQAAQHALVAGIAEMAFEELSLDKAWDTLKNSGSKKFAQKILDILMGAGIEGSEEVFTEIANKLGDDFAKADWSEYNQNVKKYGKDEADKMFLSQILQAGAAGFVSGGLTNIAMSGVSTINYHNSAKNLNENTEALQNVIDLSANKLEPGSAAYEAVTKFENGQRVFKTAEEMDVRSTAALLEEIESTKGDTQDVLTQAFLDLGETEEQAKEDAQKIIDMSNEHIDMKKKEAEGNVKTEDEERETSNLQALEENENLGNVYAQYWAGKLTTVDEAHNAAASGIEGAKAQNRSETKSNIQNTVDKAVNTVKSTLGVNEYRNTESTITNAHGEQVSVKAEKFADNGIQIANGSVMNTDSVIDGMDQKQAKVWNEFNTANGNTNLKNTMLSYYQDNMPLSLFKSVGETLYSMGASGVSYETVMRNKAMNTGIIADIIPETYKYKAYLDGINSVTKKGIDQVITKSVPKSAMNNAAGKGGEVYVTRRDSQIVDFANEMSKATGMPYALMEKLGNNLERGGLKVNKGVIALATDNMYVMGHETFGEVIKAYNPDGYYDNVKPMIMEFAQSKRGAQLLNEDLSAYLQTYQQKDSNKTIADASDEYVNDVLGVLMMSEDGLKELHQWMIENKGEEKAKTFGQVLADLYEKLADLFNQILHKNPGHKMGEELNKASEEAKRMRQIVLNEWGIALDNLDQMKAGKEVEDLRKAGETANPKKVTEEYNKIDETDKIEMSLDVEKTDRLLAVHNLTEDQLIWSLENGGFPAPSIAIIRYGMEHSQYGPISVLFNRDSIDPETDKKNRVYASDAWTPTVQGVEYEIKTDEYLKFTDMLYGLKEKMNDFYWGDCAALMGNYGNNATTVEKDEAVNRAAEKTGIKAAYLTYINENTDPVMMEKDPGYDRGKTKLYDKVIESYGDQAIIDYGYVRGMEARKEWTSKYGTEKAVELMDVKEGEKVPAFKALSLVREAYNYMKSGGTTEMIIDHEATENMINEKISGKYDDMIEWLDSYYSKFYGKKGIRNGKDYMTNSGVRRTYDQLHYAYTVENIVKAMYENQDARGQNAWGQSAFGLQSAASKEFKNVEDIRKESKKLSKLDEEKYKEIMDATSEKIGQIVRDIEAENPRSYILYGDVIGQTLMKCAQGKRTAENIRKTFKNENDITISNAMAGRILDVIEEAAGLPTAYFEAKPQRAMYIEEIAKVVLPSDSSADLFNLLDKNSIPYEAYEEGKEEQRKEAVNDENIAFALDVNVMSNLSEEDKENYDKFGKEISKLKKGKLNAADSLKVLEHTTKILIDAGLEDKAIYMTQKHFRDITHPEDTKVPKAHSEWHGLSENEVQEITVILNNPAIIMDSPSSNNSIVVFGESVDYKKRPIMIAITTEGDARVAYKIEDSNFALSIYGRNNFKNYIENAFNNNDILFMSKNKSQSLYRQFGVQFPALFSNFDFDKIVHQSRNIVKRPNEFNSKKEKLSADQQEFFKNSVVRDKDGRLLVMYHGTPNGTFSVFRGGSYFSDMKWYADGYQNQSASMLRYKKTADNPSTYEVYLNIEKPFDTRIKKVRDLFYKEYYKKWGTGTDLMEDGLPDWTDAEDIMEFIEENNLDYDGVVVNEGGIPQEDGSVKSRGVSWIPVNGREQVKSVDNLNPTENEDINYSLDIYDLLDEVEAETAQQEQEILSIIKEGMDMSTEISNKTIKNVAKNIKEMYKSNIKTGYLEDNLKALFQYMSETGSVSYADVLRTMEEIARPVIEQAESIDKYQQQVYDNFVSTVKAQNISLNAEQLAEVENAYGSYYEFKRSLGNSIRLNKNGTNLDTVWTEICDASNGMLDYGTNPGDQPIRLAEVLNALKPEEQNLYGQSIEEASRDVALEIFRQFFKEQAKVDVATDLKEKMAQRSAQMNQKYKDAYNKAKKELDEAQKINIARLSDEIAQITDEQYKALHDNDLINEAALGQLKDMYEERLRKLREQRNDKIAQVRAEARESKANYMTARKTTEKKAVLNREIKDLQNMIAHPSENSSKHVPAPLVNAVIDMLEAVNLDTGANKAVAERLAKMAKVYESYKSDSTFDFDYDERTKANIEELRGMFEGKTYADLTVDELNRVIELVKALKTQIKNANNQINEERFRNADMAAQQAVKELYGSRVHDNGIAEKLNGYTNAHLNGYRFFRKISGYTDGAIMNMYNQFDEGQRKQMQIQKDLGELFSDVLVGEENQKEVKRFTSTKKEDMVDIGMKDKNGNPILITRAMRMSLIMHSMNQGNMRHIKGAGVRIPNMDIYDKNKAEAYGKGDVYRFVDYATLLKAIKENDQEKIQELDKAAQKRIDDLRNDLSEWEKKFLADAERLFHKETGKLINDTSIKLKGYALARVENYFPIKTDSNFTKTDWSGLIKDGTLEGMGMLKERKFSSNPILLEDITNVIMRQIENVSRYAGMAIPIRNFNMVLNSTSIDENTGEMMNMKKALGNVWDSSDTKYLQNLIQDLQGGRGAKDNTWQKGLMTLRSAFAGATLSLNPSVAIKQASSYPTAAAVVGAGPLMKAIKDMGKGFVKQQGIAELEEINPLLWYRNQGNATQEIADMHRSGWYAKLPNKAQKALNWTQWMDTGTVRTLEYASMYYVDEQGTYQKGTKEYWEAVSDVFTKIVEETQPNYSVLQQADIIRNPDGMVKLLVMFKTQPMQNFGILYDAAGEYAAAKNRLKAAQTEENKTAVQEAGKKLSRAVSSQLMAAFTFSAMTVLANLLLHRGYKYRDDDGEWDWKKLAIAVGEGMATTLAGVLLFGSEVYTALKSILTNERYYGIEVSTIETFNDLVENIKYLKSNAEKMAAADTEADKDQYLEKVLQYSIKLGTTVATLTGLPVNNVKNMILSMYFYGEDIVNSVKTGQIQISNKYQPEFTSKDTQYERIFDAIVNGDMERYSELVEQLEKSGKDTETIMKNIMAQVKKEYLEDPETKQYAEKWLKEQKGMSDSEVYSKIDEWDYKNETGATSYSKYSRTKDAVSAAIGGETILTEDVKNQIQTMVDNGNDEETVLKELRKYVKTKYKEENFGEELLKTYLEELGDTNADKTIENMNKTTEEPETTEEKGTSEETTEEKPKSTGKYSGIKEAVSEMNSTKIKDEKNKLLSEGEEESNVNEKIVDEMKTLYLNGEVNATKAENTLNQIGFDEKTSYWTVDRWKYYEETGVMPDSNATYYRMKGDLADVIQNGSNKTVIYQDIKQLQEHGHEDKNIVKQISTVGKKLYLESGKSNTAKQAIIYAYEAAGLTEEEAEKKIANYKE